MVVQNQMWQVVHPRHQDIANSVDYLQNTPWVVWNCRMINSNVGQIGRFAGKRFFILFKSRVTHRVKSGGQMGRQIITQLTETESPLDMRPLTHRAICANNVTTACNISQQVIHIYTIKTFIDQYVYVLVTTAASSPFTLLPTLSICLLSRICHGLYGGYF